MFGVTFRKSRDDWRCVRPRNAPIDRATFQTKFYAKFGARWPRRPRQWQYGISNTKIFLGVTLFGACDKAVKSRRAIDFTALSHSPDDVSPRNSLVLEMPYDNRREQPTIEGRNGAGGKQATTRAKWGTCMKQAKLAYIYPTRHAVAHNATAEGRTRVERYWKITVFFISVH